MTKTDSPNKFCWTVKFFFCCEMSLACLIAKDSSSWVATSKLTSSGRSFLKSCNKMLLMLLAFCEKRESEREKKGKWLREDMPLRHVPSILYHEYRFLGQIPGSKLHLITPNCQFCSNITDKPLLKWTFFVFSGSMKDVFL